MSAQLIPDLGGDGTGLDAGPRPVWIQGASKKAFHFVDPRYLARAHTAAEMSAVVTFHGEPITQGGETLTVGLVPPWRRYAVGPVVDGKAELLSQDDFAREDRAVYENSFRYRGERVDDPDKRFIPSVRTFVMVKRDHMNPGRICPLGTHIGPQEVVKGAKAYDPANDRMVDRQVNEAEERLRSEIESKDARLAALEAQVQALVGKKPAPAEDEPEMVMARCGREVKKMYLSQHVNKCKKGCGNGLSQP